MSDLLVEEESEVNSEEEQEENSELNSESEAEEITELTEEERERIWKNFEDTGILDGWDEEIVNIGNLAKWESKDSNPFRGKDLIFKNCTNLREIYADSCGITGILIEDVDDCPNLEHLSVRNNQLTKLDVANLENLKFLDVTVNKLNSLEIEGCESLEDLYCSNNELEKLDLTDNIELRNLDCSHNKIEELTVDHLVEIVTLHCHNNCLLSLNCGGLEKLKDLNVHNNNLTIRKNLFFNSYVSIKRFSNLEVFNCKSLVILYKGVIQELN